MGKTVIIRSETIVNGYAFEEELEECSPRIMLSDEEITVKKGEEVRRLAYVDDITDDKDDSKELWRKIQIKGDELDTETEGVYELK